MKTAHLLCGGLNRGTHSIADIFTFTFSYYHYRKKSKVIASAQRGLARWRSSLVLWLTRLADKVILLMYLNNARAQTTSAPARRLSSKGETNVLRRIRLSARCKWQVLQEARAQGIHPSVLLEVKRKSDPAYGASGGSAVKWMNLLNRLYLGNANRILAQGV